MRNKIKQLISIILVILFFFCVKAVHANYVERSKSLLFHKEENNSSITSLLPSFRHIHHDTELNGISTLELLLPLDAKTVRTEIISAEGVFGTDEVTAKNKGLKLVKPARSRTNSYSHKARLSFFPPGQAIFNLNQISSKQSIIKTKDFKILKIKIEAIIPALYTLRATVDDDKSTEIQIDANPDFRIDTVTPSILDTNTERTITITGQGLDIFTKVFIGNDIKILSQNTLDHNNTILGIQVIADENAIKGFRDITIVNLITDRSATLVNGLYVGPQIGMDGSPGAQGVQGPQGIPGIAGLNFCENSSDLLEVYANNLPAGSKPTVSFDPTDCELFFGIPVGFNGINGTDGSPGISGKDGMSICTNMTSTLSISSTTLAAGSMATSSFDPDACTLVLGLPEGGTGAAGINSLVKIITESAGANCATGGKKVESGLDFDNNGTLDTIEVTSTNYVCNGAVGDTGTNGTNGLTSLVKTSNEPSGSNCNKGGTKVESGLDLNSNNVLDNDEITSTSYVCGK